jgi:2-dehydro-3-deoxygluconokinase
MSVSLPRVASLGECMVELRDAGDHTLVMGFGGDTLNAAVYLSRLGVHCDYVTALGDDAISSEMIADWQREGVGVAHVLRVPGTFPGLYMIQTDPAGERHFLYWRDAAPARRLFLLEQSSSLLADLESYDLLYLSGISLAIWGEQGRSVLFGLLDRVRRRGGRVAFDTNWRARLWPDREAARRAYGGMFHRTDIALAGVADMRGLCGDDDAGAVLARLQAAGVREIVVKTDAPGSALWAGGAVVRVAAERVERVIDTTAAGDSFSAAYLAARLAGATPEQAARAGHRLAAMVIQHRGAIIPRDAMACPA